MRLLKVLIHQIINHYKICQLTLGQCDLCQSQIIKQPLLCEHCWADLPRCEYPIKGGNLLHWPAVNQLFVHRSFDQLFCFAPYIWPVDHWLKQFKYHNRFELALLLSSLLESLWYQHIVPLLDNDYLLTVVPIHPKKWQQRGYNQAHLMAKNLQHKVNARYNDTLLIRKEFTASQVGQSGNQRRKNLQHAFAIHPHLSNLPEQVIILDDVITTGSTVNAVSQLLRQQGVKTIIVLTLALSLPEVTPPKR